MLDLNNVKKQVTRIISNESTLFFKVIIEKQNEPLGIHPGK